MIFLIEAQQKKKNKKVGMECIQSGAKLPASRNSNDVLKIIQKSAIERSMVKSVWQIDIVIMQQML